MIGDNMRKKIILVIMMIMLCAGCKAKYSLTIDESGAVEETAVLTESSEFFENYEHSSVGRVIGFILEPHMTELNDNKYEVKNNVSSSDSGVILKKKYDSIEDYTNKTILYSQFSDDRMKYEKNGNKVSLSIKGQFLKASQDPNRFAVQDAVIAITVPYKVTDNNADKVSGNTYYWNFGEKDEQEREIKITYDSSKIKGKSDISSVIILLSVILVVLVILFYVYKNFKNKKENVNKI